MTHDEMAHRTIGSPWQKAGLTICVLFSSLAVRAVNAAPRELDEAEQVATRGGKICHSCTGTKWCVPCHRISPVKWAEVTVPAKECEWKFLANCPWKRCYGEHYIYYRDGDNDPGGCTGDYYFEGQKNGDSCI